MTAAALLAGTTTQASAATPAAKPRPAARTAPVCAGAAQPNPIAVTLTGVRRGYVRGGGWATLRLTLHNRTRTVCGQLKPVLVYGARSRSLRVDALRLETRLSGRWRSVGVDAALGELAGEVGPRSGLSLRPGATAALTLRMRLTRSAPTGDWLSLAVAYAPLQTKPGKGAPSGTTQAWPVGVTNPLYFRVTGIVAGGHSR
ncbi:hypothetical protein [Streptacidiphilus fuscans]|uniref:DUF4232 domain-containing protein n=1 Tax=Streptacidiphilus fuscans TaxID=2789292 RepID=A0A931B2P1_9ACTN|nr:hypothetical protein [Streptacidiphilus fuscans]MBF9067572.1 hypothetical protein [Streptacidiphilus fuscans]